MTRTSVHLGLLLLSSFAGAAAAEAPRTAERPEDRTLSVSFEGADLRTVVTAIAKMLDINLVGGDKLTGTVTVRLSKAPGMQTLDLILKNAGFALMKQEGGIYEVLPLAEKAKLDAERAKAEAEKAKAELDRTRAQARAEQTRLRTERPPGSEGEPPERPSLRVQAFPLRFADTERAAKLLVPHAIADKKNVSEDPDSRQLIVTGTPECLRNVEAVLKAIDRPLPQIAIQARVIEVFTDRVRKFGAKLTSTQDTCTGNGKSTLGFDLTQVSQAADTFIYSIASDRITAAIDALAQKDLAQILSAPNVTTVHGKKAVMKVTEQVPVVTRTTRIVDQVTVTDDTVTFKETGVTLTVTPRALAEGKITMVVEPAVLELKGWTDTNPPQPLIDARTTTTEVTISSGQWLMIGGMIKCSEHKTVRGVPILQDIPVVGSFFRSSVTTREKSNLVVLVSATILDDGKIERDIQDVADGLRHHREAHGIDGVPIKPPDNPE